MTHFPSIFTALLIIDKKNATIFYPVLFIDFLLLGIEVIWYKSNPCTVQSHYPPVNHHASHF